MFKQLLLAVLILMFSVSMAVAGCVLPKDIGVMLFTEMGMSRTSAGMDRTVLEVSDQPPAELLSVPINSPGSPIRLPLSSR